MTKVTYIGEREEITSLGIPFKKDEPREVSDRKKLDKFAGHSDFEVEGRPYELDGSVEQSLSEEGDEDLGREYTVEELTAILKERNVTIPAKAKNDAQKLLDLVMANGGLPPDPDPQ